MALKHVDLCSMLSGMLVMSTVSVWWLPGRVCMDGMHMLRFNHVFVTFEDVFCSTSWVVKGSCAS